MNVDRWMIEVLQLKERMSKETKELQLRRPCGVGDGRNRFRAISDDPLKRAAHRICVSFVCLAGISPQDLLMLSLEPRQYPPLSNVPEPPSEWMGWLM